MYVHDTLLHFLKKIVECDEYCDVKKKPRVFGIINT